MASYITRFAKLAVLTSLLANSAIAYGAQSSMEKKEMMAGDKTMQMHDKKMMMQACQRDPKKPIEYGRCLDNEKSKLDRLLTTWVNNHVFELGETVKSTGRKSALNMFNKSQKSFVNYRENNCRWHYLERLPHDDANLYYKECYLRLTQERIDELQKH